MGSYRQFLDRGLIAGLAFRKMLMATEKGTKGRGLGGSLSVGNRKEEGILVPENQYIHSAT